MIQFFGVFFRYLIIYKLNIINIYKYIICILKFMYTFGFRFSFNFLVLEKYDLEFQKKKEKYDLLGYL